LENINIVLGVTGSIAAYKAAELANLLAKEGAEVHTIMTDAATKFITPLTFQSLTKQRVYRDMFEEVVYRDIRHISLAQGADIFVIAPATANIIGKIAGGIADDMLSTVVMATESPIIICPAMNTAMYENPIVQANIANLKDLGYIFVEPRESRLACGDLGKGAMAEISTIIDTIKSVLADKEPAFNHLQSPPKSHDKRVIGEAQYSLEDVEAHLQDPQVELLFERVEEILGKLLKDSERQMYLSFYDEMGMSVELIEFMLEYCLERGKKGSAYLRAVAQNWVEQGIDDVETAQEYISLFNNEFREILRHFGISGRDPIPKEIQYMQRWLTEDNFSLDIIRLACEKTIINKANANFPYADGILSKWKAENITTIAEIEALEKDYYDNVNSWKRPMKKEAGRQGGAKKFQNYKGRKWDYEELARLDREYIAKKVAE
jgi:phosphopantothenoylcysteine decarboxylase/phosphopantothenoylcysteine decarboxylase/phosphopantothenate--cysteine ligase